MKLNKYSMEYTCSSGSGSNGSSFHFLSRIRSQLLPSGNLSQLICSAGCSQHSYSYTGSAVRIQYGPSQIGASCPCRLSGWPAGLKLDCMLVR